MADSHNIRVSLEEDQMKYKFAVYCHNCRTESTRWFDLSNEEQSLFCQGCQKKCVIDNKGEGYGKSVKLYLEVDKTQSECEFSLRETN